MFAASYLPLNRKNSQSREGEKSNDRKVLTFEGTAKGRKDLRLVRSGILVSGALFTRVFSPYFAFLSFLFPVSRSSGVRAAARLLARASLPCSVVLFLA